MEIIDHGPVKSIIISTYYEQHALPFLLRHPLYRVAPKNSTVDYVRLCSDQQFFFTLLDRASFYNYDNTKIIRFG